MKITFEVIRESEGGYVASCMSEKLFAEGSNLEELHTSISSAIDRGFEGRDKPDPASVQLMLYHE